MVTNYSNSNGGTMRILDQVSRKYAGILSNTSDNNGAMTVSVTAWFDNDAGGGTGGQLQCLCYDSDNSFLTQIGSDIPVSTLTSSATEQTFTATSEQKTNSQWSEGTTGYIMFHVDGSGSSNRANVELEATGASVEKYSSLPRKAVSAGSWSTFDTGNYMYFKGTIAYEGGSFSTGTRLPPPPLIARF